MIEDESAAAKAGQDDSEEESGFISRPVYKVQLASLRERRAAEDFIAQLQRRHSTVLAGTELEVEEADLGAERGTFYRVKTAALPSAEAASAMCDTFKSRNMGCLTVRSIDVAAFVAPKPSPAGREAAARPAPVAAIDTKEPDTTPRAEAGSEELSVTASLEEAEDSLNRLEPAAEPLSADQTAESSPSRDSTAGQSGAYEPAVARDPESGPKSAPEPSETPYNPQEAESGKESPLPLASDVEDRFRVQLASRRNEEDARAQWRLVRGAHPDILRGYAPKLEQADLGEKGIFYRLQVSPFATFAEAEALCARLKSAGQDCFVTRTP
ncbi:MAG: SPOR domain-containing protein [Alphaproteobacteria bacterium]|nr:SPOR domain-containing protein [Alphaproteobacteria bacterium]